MAETKKQEFYARIPIEEKLGQQQKGRMKVGAQIIEQLSKGVYSNPEMAIKELISNSFDADATEVLIETKSGFGSISIRDNGHGMDYKDFDNDYVFISKSPHVGKDEKTKILNRPVIGRLGIGFLAVSQLCDTLIITSAKRNENTKFVAVLDFGKFKNKDNRGAEFSDISEYVLTNYEKKNRDESFTHIELKDLTKPFRNILRNIPEPGVKLKKTDDLDFVDVVRKVWNAKDYLEIEKTYGPYWKFVINLASIVPVEYMKNGPIKDKRYSELVKPFKDYTSDLNFKVFFDGMQIKKPYLLPTPEAKKSGNFSVLTLNNNFDVPGGGRISYRGYVYNQDGGIDVNDLRGLIIRVKNTSVGIISQNFFDYPFLDTMYFRWTFGEIFVDEGLEEAMNIDRATFKKQDPEYYAFITDLHDKLRSVVFESVQKRWRIRVKKQIKELENYKQDWRQSSLRNSFGKKFVIKNDTRLNKPVSISLKDAVVLFNPESPILEKFPRKERELLKDVILEATIAREKYHKDQKNQEQLFLKLLENLAKNYPKTGLKFKYKRL